MLLSSLRSIRRVGARLAIHVVVGFAFGLVFSSRSARADESGARPPLGSNRPRAVLPSPFVLPDLSHPRFDLRVDWFIGWLSPEIAGRPRAVGGLVRPSIETSVFRPSRVRPRRLFVGLTCPFAAALPPDGGLARGEVATPSGTRTMLGNLEAHVRSVFPLPSQLEIGFVLGVVAPTATFDRNLRPNRSAVDAVSSFDPTNHVDFLRDRVVLRPAVDLRIVRGPFVVQGRQGIDILIDNQGIDSAKVAGRLIGHIGYLARSDLEVSVEASQIYFFASDDKVTGPPGPETVFADTYRIGGSRRTAVTMGPGVRLAYRDVDVGMALVANVSEPLSPVAGSFVALRFSVIGHAFAADP